MSEDPVQILQKAAALRGDDSQAAALVPTARRVVEVCDAGDKVSRAVLKSDSKPVTTSRSPVMNTTPLSTSSPAVNVDFMAKMEETRLKLDEALPQFPEVFRKIEALEDCRKQGEESFSALLRRLAAAVGLPETAADSATMADIETLGQKQEKFSSAHKTLSNALEALASADALSTASSALERGEAPPEGFQGLDAIAKRKKDEAQPLLDAFDSMDSAYAESGFAEKSPMEVWESFKNETLAVREAALTLPESKKDDVLREWGLGLDQATSLPDGYRMLDVGEAKFAVRGLLQALAKDFSDAVAAADAAQPPFERVDASSINVSGAFPSKLAVGRIDSFPPKHGDALRNCDIPKTMPRCIDFSALLAPLAYEDADVPQALVLRLAQAMPQGLFEAYALDSDNIGQTFREISGLRKSGILTVSTKNDDDERILSELDAWLGDLSDRGYWDDSSDWADYNRKHPDTPLPFKLVIFPSLAALESQELSTVAKLVRNGPASGVVPAFSSEALTSLADRSDEPAAKALRELVGPDSMTSLEALVSASGESDEAPEEPDRTDETARDNAALAARPAPEERVYEPAEIDDSYSRAQQNFKEEWAAAYLRPQILRIVNAEGPIAEDLLFQRVLEEWGWRIATGEKAVKIRKAVPDTIPVTTHNGRETFWPVGAAPSEWNAYRVPGASRRSRRTFGQIPPEEIAAAIVAEHHASSGDKPMDDYVPGALGRLGLPRTVMPDMRGALDAAKSDAKHWDNQAEARKRAEEEERQWAMNHREATTYGLPPANIRQRLFDAIAEARKAAQENRPKAPSLGMDVLFADTTLWSGNATDGFAFPIGVRENGSPLVMEIGDANVHGLVGGMTGSGKSNLLHAIIHSLCWKYSPAELELHLLDYKDGMEFKVYSNEDESAVWMPHAKTISTHNDPAYALSLFDELQREAMRRKKFFGSARNYREFRQKGGKLPRVFVLVDEFHKLFEGHEKGIVEERIMQILKQGRAYGIHLLMSTQALRGIDVDRAALGGQISIRLALRGNEDDGILDMDNDAAAHIERPMCVYNDKTGMTSGNHLFKVPFVDVSSDAESTFREKIAAATADGGFHCKGRVFRGTELPHSPSDASLFEDAPDTTGIAVRIGVHDDYLAQPAFVVLDDAPNGHFIAAAPNGNDALDDAGNLTCNDVWEGLFASVAASLAATPKTAVVLYDPLARTKPASLPEEWTFLGAGAGEGPLLDSLKTLAEAPAEHRVLVVLNWAKAVKLHPHGDSGGSSFLDEPTDETARAVFASAFSSANDTLPFHVMLFVRNFTYAKQETFGEYGEILKNCSQRVGVNLSEDDLSELFPSMNTNGSAHRIFFGSTDSDEVFRFLPFRAEG